MAKKFDSIMAELAKLGNDTFVAAVQALDKTVNGVVKAAQEVQERRGNLSADILNVIKTGDSPEHVLAAVSLARSLYIKKDAGDRDDPRYNQYNNALSNIKRGFRRITGVSSAATADEQAAAFENGWAEIQAEAGKEGMNFARFWKGAPQKAPSTPRNAQAAKAAPKRQPEGWADYDAAEDATVEGWDTEARNRFTSILTVCRGAVATETLTQHGADTIMETVYAVFVAEHGEATAEEATEAVA